LVVLLAIFCVCNAQLQRVRPPSIPADWRLIETAKDKSEWMSPEQITKLIQECGKADQDHAGHGGFFDITDYPLLGKLKVPEADPLPTDCKYDPSVVNPLINMIDMNNWVNDVTALSSLSTRYYTSQNGTKGAEYLYNRLTQMCGSNCSVSYFTHSWPQSSVVMRIKGTTNDVVIVGAHQDSTASPSTANAPGADDDASGCGGVLEIARVLLNGNFTTKRNIEFHFYSAEEVDCGDLRQLQPNMLLTRSTCLQ